MDSEGAETDRGANGELANLVSCQGSDRRHFGTVSVASKKRKIVIRSPEEGGSGSGTPGADCSGVSRADTPLP